MNYARWNDDDLRRALSANPKDIDAVMEGAARFERGATPTEIEELQEKIKQLEADVEGAQQSAKEWEEDYDEECKRSAELEKERDALKDRVDELEASGAGLL
jgi:chromosome segregation ATPase